MSDAEMDFHTYVASHYEMRRVDELPAGAERDTAVSVGLDEFRHLLQVDKPKLVRPKRKTLDFIIGLLLKFPKEQVDPKAPYVPPNAEEMLRVERNVLAIAKQIGLLWTGLNPDRAYGESLKNRHESVYEWLRFAQTIQSMFSGKRLPEFPIATLDAYLTPKPGGSSVIAVRPGSTRGALAFHAAQMIAKGTTSRTCEHCGTAFLSGGRGEEKKRGGSRFCSDQCRYRYHNEEARRRKHK